MFKKLKQLQICLSEKCLLRMLAAGTVSSGVLGTQRSMAVLVELGDFTVGTKFRLHVTVLI